MRTYVHCVQKKSTHIHDLKIKYTLKESEEFVHGVINTEAEDWTSNCTQLCFVQSISLTVILFWLTDLSGSVNEDFIHFPQAVIKWFTIWSGRFWTRSWSDLLATMPFLQIQFWPKTSSRMLELLVLLLAGTKRITFFSKPSITRNSHSCCLS